VIAKWRPYIILGLLSYGIFLLNQLPVNLPYVLVQEQLSEQKVNVYGLEGTLWEGRMARVEVGGREFDNIQWQLHPSALLTGRLSATLSFANADSQVSARLSRSFSGDLDLQDMRGRLAAKDVLAMAKIPAIQLDGQFNVNIATMTLSEQRLSHIKGMLTWSGAGTRFPQNLKLGDLSAQLSTGDDGVIKAILSDAGGVLEANGSLALKPAGQYDFDGVFAAREGKKSSLGRALRMLGSSDAEGKVTVKNSGSLSDLGL
jgi:general secretion pathway protein N